VGPLVPVHQRVICRESCANRDVDSFVTLATQHLDAGPVLMISARTCAALLFLLRCYYNRSNAIGIRRESRRGLANMSRFVHGVEHVGIFSGEPFQSSIAKKRRTWVLFESLLSSITVLSTNQQGPFVFLSTVSA
jgi:hypothetical protein